MKRLVLLVTILAMVLGGGSLALAQTEPSSDQTGSNQTATNDQSTNKQTINGRPANNQTTNNPATNDQTTNNPSTTNNPTTTNGQANGQTTNNPSTTTDQSANLPCGVSLFRLEQQELVQSGYPTPVSARARECENLGYVNPYPAPALRGPDGFVYPYDPIEGQYLYLDPSTGLYYILDPASDTVSTYDPTSGTYV